MGRSTTSWYDGLSVVNVRSSAATGVSRSTSEKHAPSRAATDPSASSARASVRDPAVDVREDARVSRPSSSSRESRPLCRFAMTRCRWNLSRSTQATTR